MEDFFCFMRMLLRLYKHINILSLDIVAGAVISALFFSKVLYVSIMPQGLVALGLTVWIIYTADHLRDARKIQHTASTARHRFHQRHFKVLLFALALAIIADALTIFYIRKQVLIWGLILTPVVALYLVGQQYLRIAKELLIAILYTFGVLLLSVSVTDIHLTAQHYLMIVHFAFMAWINLVMFSWFDYHHDRSDELKSFVTILGRKSTERFLWLLFGAGGLLTVRLYVPGISGPVLVLTSMYVVLLLVFVFRNGLTQHDSYRIIGDSVFMFPLLYLL